MVPMAPETEADFDFSIISNGDEAQATSPIILARTMESGRYRESGPCKSSYNLMIVHSNVVRMPVLEMTNELFKP